MRPAYKDYRRHRAKVFKRDGYTCFYCGHNKVQNLSLDHITPKSKGGSDNPSNLLTACKKCNNMKGDMGLDEFIEYVNKIHGNLRR